VVPAGGGVNSCVDSSTNGHVTFPNGPISMAGNLYFPPDFDPQGSYAELVTVHLGGGVKDQTAGLYASKLADQGFVTLAFDASYRGASGRDPHHLEDPPRVLRTSARRRTICNHWTTSTPSASVSGASAPAGTRYRRWRRRPSSAPPKPTAPRRRSA